MVGQPGEDGGGLFNRNDGKLFNDQINGLYDALDVDDVRAANAIIAAMGDSKNMLAVEPLCILLEYPDDSIRGSSALALLKLGDRSAIKPLVNALKDSPDKVKINIVAALGTLGDKRVIPALESIPLTPDEPKLINAVRSAVYRINHPNGPEKSSPPPAPKPVTAQAPVAIPVPDAEATYGTVRPKGIKYPLLAALGSAVLPGLGQVYNGEGYKKGILLLAGSYIGILFLILPGLLIWMYSIYNAYTEANRINAGEVEAAEVSGIRVAAFAVAGLVGVPLVFVIIVVLVAVIAAFVFPINAPGQDRAMVPHPAFTIMRANSTSVIITFQDMGRATSVMGLSIEQPAVSDPVLVSPTTPIVIGQPYVLNDPKLSGPARIVATSIVNGEKQVVIDMYV